MPMASKIKVPDKTLEELKEIGFRAFLDEVSNLNDEELNMVQFNAAWSKAIAQALITANYKELPPLYYELMHGEQAQATGQEDQALEETEDEGGNEVAASETVMEEENEVQDEEDEVATPEPVNNGKPLTRAQRANLGHSSPFEHLENHKIGKRRRSTPEGAKRKKDLESDEEDEEELVVKKKKVVAFSGIPRRPKKKAKGGVRWYNFG